MMDERRAPNEDLSVVDQAQPKLITRPVHLPPPPSSFTHTDSAAAYCSLQQQQQQQLY